MVDFAQLGPELVRLANERDFRFRDGYLFVPVRTRDGFHTHHYVLKYTLRDWVKAKFTNELFAMVKDCCTEEMNPFCSRYLYRLVESFANPYSERTIVPKLKPLVVNVALVSYANGVYNTVTQQITPYASIDVEHELAWCMTSAYVHLIASPATTKLPSEIKLHSSTWKSRKILDLSKIVIGAPIKSKADTVSTPVADQTNVPLEYKSKTSSAEDPPPFFRPFESVTRMTMEDMQRAIDGPKVVVHTDSTPRASSVRCDNLFGNLGAERSTFVPPVAVAADTTTVSPTLCDAHKTPTHETYGVQ